MGAKIRSRYNQVPHPTQDTNGKVTKSPKSTQCPWDITVSVIECILSIETSLYRFRDENLNNFPDNKPLMKKMGLKLLSMPWRDFSVSAYELFLLVRNMKIYGLWAVIRAVPSKPFMK